MNTVTIYGKLFRGGPHLDGCTTIQKLIERHEQQVRELRELDELGVTLLGTVTDGEALLVISNPTVAEEWCFYRELEFEGNDWGRCSETGPLTGFENEGESEVDEAP